MSKAQNADLKLMSKGTKSRSKSELGDVFMNLKQELFHVDL